MSDEQSEQPPDLAETLTTMQGQLDALHRELNELRLRLDEVVRTLRTRGIHFS